MMKREEWTFTNTVSFIFRFLPHSRFIIIILSFMTNNTIIERDPKTGKEFMRVSRPKFRIDDQVIFPHYSEFQKPFDLVVDGSENKFHKQLIVGTIIGATFNPDGTLEWKYFIKSPVQTSPGGDSATESDIILLECQEVCIQDREHEED